MPDALPRDVVPDPRRDGQVPWTLYVQVLGFAILSFDCWWAAAHVDGLVRVVCWVLCAAAGLYAAYLLVLSAGWQLLTTVLGTVSRRLRRAEALRSGEQLLELRFGSSADEAPESNRDLLVALDEGLGPDAECGGVGSLGGAVTAHVRGKELPLMVDAVRRAVAGLPVPPDAYLWAPDLARVGYGRILPLRDSPAGSARAD